MLKRLTEADQAFLPVTNMRAADESGVPDYLRRHYWWAYIHPRAVRFFDRLWLINLILLGNYKKLRDTALAEFTDAQCGNVLQLACVYGDLTSRLTRLIAAVHGKIDIVDILPVQLKNMKWKLPGRSSARLMCMDTTDLSLPEASYDWVMLFFLLHEQPAFARTRTLAEAFRVVKPGGKILIVDYARPFRWNPLRYLLRLPLAVLEPFALDLWRDDITAWFPPLAEHALLKRRTFFGGFYQKVVVTRPETEITPSRL
jgi:ubiquinone/menaquinone biosynthesis C-methylase UbiE